MTRAVVVLLLIAGGTVACGRPAPGSESAPPAKAAERPDPAMARKAGYDETRDPAKDLAAIIPTAEATHRRILLVVGGEWCVWCHYLHDFLEKEADVRKLWDERFVTLHVNWSENNKNVPFLSQYPKIPGYPHIFVLDENGKFLHSQGTEVLESGRGYSTEAVRAFLEKWSSSRFF